MWDWKALKRGKLLNRGQQSCCATTGLWGPEDYWRPPFKSVLCPLLPKAMRSLQAARFMTHCSQKTVNCACILLPDCKQSRYLFDLRRI